MFATVATTQVVEVTQDERVISAAIQLHRLGLNVLPIKLPQQLILLANYQKMGFPARNIINPQQKMPFILAPFFRNRMHLCNETCQVLERETGRPCPGAHASHKFAYAFQEANLGLVLGATSQNMSMIDCDDEESFREMLNEFRQRGLDHWAHSTSRGGHIFFRAKEGIISKDRHSPYEHLEIYGENRFSVIPPSLHFDGSYYCWINNGIHTLHLPFNSLPAGISIADLKWLGVSVTTSVINNSQSLPAWTAYQSKNNQQLWSAEIIDGHRNTLLRNLVYDGAAIIKNGLADEDEVMAMLYDRVKSCQPPYSTRQIDSMMKSAMRNDKLTLSSRSTGKSRTNAYFLNYITLIANMADQYDWCQQGRRALGNRVVFFACLLRALQEGRKEFRASLREVAELANIQKPHTISKAFTSLQSFHFLIQSDQVQSGAYMYEFGEKFDVFKRHINTSIDTVPIKNIIENHIPINELEKDVFRRLGKVAYIVWKYLSKQGGASIQSICADCHLNRSGVNGALGRLTISGLVIYSQAERVYIATPYSEEKLLQIAIEQGTLGNAARRHRHFVIEREIRLTEQVLRSKAKFYNQIDQIRDRQERDTNETR